MNELYDRLKDVSARFDATHKEGMASLRRGDYEGFGEAIEIERALIEEQADILKAIRKNHTYVPSVKKC